MALVLYFSLGNITKGGVDNILSAMVSRDVLQMWNLDENEIFDRALEDTMRLQPPVFLDIASGLGSILKLKHILFMDDEMVKIDFDSPLAPTISTEGGINHVIPLA